MTQYQKIENRQKRCDVCAKFQIIFFGRTFVREKLFGEIMVSKFSCHVT